MDSGAAWSVECREAVEAVAASVAALAACIGAGADHADLPGTDFCLAADPLRDLADACLDGLAEVARLEARSAALKVRLAAEYVRAARALAPPAASPQERTAQEMAVVAEVACVLTVSERSAGALLSDCQVLTTALPLTLDALQAGTISWQHARIMVDETASLDPAGAAGAGGAFPGPRRPGSGPRVPGRGARAGPVPRQGTHLAGTPPPGQHRDTPRQVCRGPAGRVRPGPGRHGLAQRVPPGRHRRGDLGTDHRRGPGPAGPGRGPDPDPAPRRHRRHLAPHRRTRRRRHRRRDRPGRDSDGIAGRAAAGDGGTGTGGIAGGLPGGGGAGRAGAGRGCAVAAGAGPGHRPGDVPAGRHR